MEFPFEVLISSGKSAVVSVMKIAFLVTDNREAERRYELPAPFFGTAPTALLQGFAGMLTSDSKLSTPEIHVISCTQRPMSSPTKLAGNIWFHSLVVPKSGWLRSGYFGCARAVGRKLMEIQPDLVHAQGTERECAISAMLSRYPKVLTIHGNLRQIRREVGFPLFSAIWFQSFLEGIVVPRFDGIICISQYTQDAVKTEARRTWVVSNAVDSAFFALPDDRMHGAARQAGPSGLEQSLLVPATVDVRKNQNSFIRALDLLPDKTGLHVVFMGKCADDPYGRAFLKLVKERPWCRFEGFLSSATLREYLSNASALVLPSLEDNCPMAVLEAMAAGVPVLASRVGGIPELVEDGVNGLLFDPLSPESIRTAVSRVLTDRKLATKLSSNAKNKALQKFQPGAVALRHLEIYREVLERQL